MQIVRTIDDTGRLGRNGLGVIEPRHDAYDQSAQNFPEVIVNERVPVAVNPQSPRQLDPIIDSDFSSVGKPPGHDKAYSDVAYSLSIRDNLSVDAWNPEDGYVAKWLFSNIVATPRGWQTAFIESTNIDRSESRPYGDQFTVSGISGQSIADYYIG